MPPRYRTAAQRFLRKHFPDLTPERHSELVAELEGLLKLHDSGAYASRAEYLRNYMRTYMRDRRAKSK